MKIFGNLPRSKDKKFFKLRFQVFKAELSSQFNIQDVNKPAVKDFYSHITSHTVFFSHHHLLFDTIIVKFSLIQFDLYSIKSQQQ